MIKLGIMIAEEQYRDRLIRYLMNHYADRIRPEIYCEDPPADCDAILAEGNLTWLTGERKNTYRGKCFYLQENGVKEESDTEDIIYMDKYQDVNRIVDGILDQIGREVQELRRSGEIPEQMQMYGVYGLDMTAYQLPYAVTMAAILSEKNRVLLLDLQENSGLQQMVERKEHAGLEELLLMAESGHYSKTRLLSCIGSMQGIDYIYPARNTENICEVREGTVLTMLGLLIRETAYDILIINFGSRFCGFFDTLQKCSRIFLLQSQIKSSWREEEFMEELYRRKAESVEGNLVRTELPATGAGNCRRLIELWRWNEVGDKIRRISAER